MTRRLFHAEQRGVVVIDIRESPGVLCYVLYRKEMMSNSFSLFVPRKWTLNRYSPFFMISQHTNDFPLYTEAIKFFNHSESMVRIAVRTLTLNVYKIEEESMIKFVIDKTAVPYFSNLVWFIGNHILDIDACVRNDAEWVSYRVRKQECDLRLKRFSYSRCI